jgi:hypothetical protein
VTLVARAPGCSAAAAGSMGLICLYCCIRSGIVDGGEVVPSLSSLAGCPSSPFCRTRNIGQREMIVVIARPWWHVLVGGKMGEALRSSRVVVF